MSWWLALLHNKFLDAISQFLYVQPLVCFSDICGRRHSFKELPDFELSFYCHNKSVCEISSILAIPQSLVSVTLSKWKSFGTIAIQPQIGIPRKVTEWDYRELCVKVANTASSITVVLQTSLGINMSTITVHQELHGIGFRGQTITETHYTFLVQ